MRSGGSSSSTRGPDMPGRAVRATLVYDTDCSTCSRFAGAVRALDRAGRIRLVSMHDGEVERRLRPELGEAFDHAFHLVLEPGGQVLSGEAALHDLARLLPAVRPFAEVIFGLPGLRRLPGALYGWAARGRTCDPGRARQRTV